MSDPFVLHGSPHSLYTYKVALMLRLCGVGFSFRYISFQKGMQLTPEFRGLSRWGQVPVLEHGGRALVQSAAVLEYSSETLGRFGAPDIATRQEVREWLFWNADRLSPPLFGWYGVALGRRGLLPLSYDPGVVARWRSTGETALGVLDDALASRRFLVADQPTIADICCYGEIAFARMSGADLGQWRHLTAWAARIEALPGWAAPLDLLPMADAEFGPRLAATE
jgi:glutathione S-transferase